MAGLAWVVNPASVVPVVLVLEIVASVLLWQGSGATAHQGWLRALVVGNLVTVPMGVALLLLLPLQPLRAVVAVLLFTVAFALRFVVRAELRDSTVLRRLCSGMSGLVNGLAASGGVIAAMTMTAACVPASQLRATMILYLLIADAYVVTLMLVSYQLGVIQWSPVAGDALFSGQLVLLAAALGLPMAAGIALGRRKFEGTRSSDYRGFVLNLFMLMSGISLLLVVIR